MYTYIYSSIRYKMLNNRPKNLNQKLCYHMIHIICCSSLHVSCQCMTMKKFHSIKSLSCRREDFYYFHIRHTVANINLSRFYFAT